MDKAAVGPNQSTRCGGQSVTRLVHVAEQAVASAANLEDAGIGVLRIDTHGRTVQQVADTITTDAVLAALFTW
ncbi:hypothetical protein G3M58_64255 [Streptomyces sp. SID7499]|uniref:Uncharacterized protein n=1 Tax=Streptomyces sp. SID7499 TaxID=2706086 RepID=A0A6G3XI07_9ACTN|nr:hypothetical protein [Streptomyces sp. SID7499]